MASYARSDLVNKFRKEVENWNSMGGLRSEKAMDTTHIQMASLDEMMSAYGYVPRRVPKYPNITDGRFGYARAFPDKHGDRPQFISLENAVSIHNGNGYRGNPFRKLSDRMSFALRNRIVEQVAIQRDKRWGNDASGIKTTKRWVKFCGEE